MLYSFLISIFYLLIILSSVGGLVIVIYRSIKYIENHAYAAGKRIKKIIQINALSHIILILRGYPFWQVIFSLGTLFLFFNLLYDYPAVPLESPFFIGGTVCALINHFLFLRILSFEKYYLLEVFFWFIWCVWVVPFAFFLSITANDDSLPEYKKKRVTLVHKLINKLMK